ncbi:uncharacterized protein LOC114301581 [Camellia sinensis]|uniref:uncharacterized protein LOC114301581 n=1 Tax=Camellia sinensis TaxID=4442 RepID=UPI001036528B|nr:uncharacterized protein LOC114301581 [Camellia sinensis]
MDMIGKIHPPSSKHHYFILVATNYFTKWVKAKPYKAVDQTEVIGFIKDLIHSFGIPETITIDNGIVFDGKMYRRKPFLVIGLCKAANGILENDVSNSKQVPKSSGGEEALLIVEELSKISKKE